jgi:xanthine dehydrogenase small subunit
MAERAGTSAPIRFLLGGEVVSVDDAPPTCTVLAWLRARGRTGTKEGCAEGDCGACTVVVAERSGDGVAFAPVNACIRLLPTLDGKALYTVEDLRQRDGALHPAQEAMVACHGSQCGFCTPGFVMSLWALYLQHEAAATRPSDREIRSALTGNLCRCTGYRPILEAGARMFDLPKAPFDRRALAERLEAIARDGTLAYGHAGVRFLAPRTLPELLALRAAHPAATLVAGATDVGLWVTKALRELPEILYVGEVAALKSIREHGGVLHIGAAATLTDACRALAGHYPETAEIWERFGSVPIRNAGTLGGNVANGSPIGDSMPPLIALGARVVLASVRGVRAVPLEDLYVAYQKKAMAADELVTAVEIPLRGPALALRTYKVSKRFDSDISAVCAAFALDLDGGCIAACRIAFGGMAPTPKRAPLAEAALAGGPWNEAAARAAMAALASDFAPISDMRASAGYRLTVARNLLWRCFLETRAQHPLAAGEVSVFATA